MNGPRTRGQFGCWAAALTLLLALAAGHRAGAADFLKGPYLIYPGDNTGMTVLWQADGPAETSTIEVGTDPALGQGPITVPGYGDNQYKHTLTGLTPGVRYHYRVTVDREALEGEFRAAPPDAAAAVTIYAYGDSRSRPIMQDLVLGRLLRDMEAHDERLTLCLHSGDWAAVASSERQWQRQHFSMSHAKMVTFRSRVPVMGAKGNHEFGGGLFRKYYPYDTPVAGEYYYSFDYGPVHVTVLDDYANHRPGSAQHQWIADDLRDSAKPWKIVVLHEPAWSAAGLHPNNHTNQLLADTLFAEYGVDLVLAGHNHYYARHEKDGLTHITTGGGGAPLARPDPSTAFHIQSSRSLHFLRLEAAVDGLQVTVIDDGGRTIDRFVVEGEGSPATVRSTPLTTKREVPIYDGRAPDDPTPEEVLVWIPRIALGPLLAVDEFILHRPIGALVTELERARVPGKARYMVENRPVGVPGFFPTTMVEFGFRPSIGIYFFWDQFPIRSGRFRIHAAFGGMNWWRLKVKQRFFLRPMRDSDRVLGWDRSQIVMYFLFKRRPDHMFFGMGTEARDRQTRFLRDQIGGGVEVDLALGRHDALELRIGVERNQFAPGYRNKKRPEPSIEEYFDVADPGVVPGFDGYTLGLLSLKGKFDTRRDPVPAGSGFRAEARVDLGSDLQDPGNRFLRYGGIIGVFLDPTGTNRVLHLKQDLWLVQPVQGRGAVPFTEQINLGGVDLLRGFPPGRYRGMSAWVTTVEYIYPIWVFLDGVAFGELGNVFGQGFEGFSFEKMVMSWGLGMRTKAIQDVTIDVMIGFGTSRFDDPPFRIAQVRFVAGINKGF